MIIYRKKILILEKIPKNSQKFPKIPKNSQKFPKIPKNSQKFPKINCY
jgi:hypothetical protein